MKSCPTCQHSRVAYPAKLPDAKWFRCNNRPDHVLFSGERPCRIGLWKEKASTGI